MKYLLDTCVVSETISRNPDPTVSAWLDGMDEDDLFISSLTVGEIRKGIEKMPGCKRKEVLSHWLDQLKSAYAGRIVCISTEVADDWGRRIARSEMKGADGDGPRIVCVELIGFGCFRAIIEIWLQSARS